MKSISILFAAVLLSQALSPVTASAREEMFSPSGIVRIVGGELEMKSVEVGGKRFPLGDFHGDLIEKVGSLVLVSVASGGVACPTNYAWLDTTPGHLRLTETFGTCSEIYELSHDAETVTLTMPSMDPSEGQVAFIFDGHSVVRKVLGLKSSKVARNSAGNADAWIGESPYEYLTAAEMEPTLLREMTWSQLDMLRRYMTVGSQQMTVEGNWIVGSGCLPHVCNTDHAAIALYRSTGQLVAAIKRDGHEPVLIGEPPEALPNTIRAIMVEH
ncbi:hypothetical protein [Thioclava sp. F28-4]|uniref:hypothetical protein n=1 Tax=Thioclava sp. F28-4 TaxID=1915315 RepID=UPI000998B4B1|nr:hypothetical protein [Thioclava sp. F28-4]OOY03207.1 hypothetical protein BMI87_18985 [Thioclava sp. F28-4]